MGLATVNTSDKKGTVSLVVPSFRYILEMVRITRWPSAFRKLIFSVFIAALAGGGK
jgi:hypothetical protein